MKSKFKKFKNDKKIKVLDKKATTKVNGGLPFGSISVGYFSTEPPKEETDTTPIGQ